MDAAWLSDLRTLLLFGFFASLILTVWLWSEPGPPKAAAEFCKLHARPLKDCPPESHSE